MEKKVNRSATSALLKFLYAAAVSGPLAAAVIPTSTNEGESHAIEQMHAIRVSYDSLYNRMKDQMRAVSHRAEPKESIIEKLFGELMRQVSDSKNNVLFRTSQRSLSAADSNARQAFVEKWFAHEETKKNWDIVIRYMAFNASTFVKEGETRVNDFILGLNDKNEQNRPEVDVLKQRILDDPEFLNFLLARIELDLPTLILKHSKEKDPYETLEGLDAMRALNSELLRVLIAPETMSPKDALDKLADIVAAVEEKSVCTLPKESLDGTMSAICAGASQIDRHVIWKGEMPVSTMGKVGLELLTDRESRSTIEALLAFIWNERTFFEKDTVLRDLVFAPLDKSIQAGKATHEKLVDIDRVIKNLGWTQTSGVDFLASTFANVQQSIKKYAGIVGRITDLITQKAHAGDQHAKELLPRINALIRKMVALGKQYKE